MVLGVVSREKKLVTQRRKEIVEFLYENEFLQPFYHAFSVGEEEFPWERDGFSRVVLTESGTHDLPTTVSDAPAMVTVLEMQAL